LNFDARILLNAVLIRAGKRNYFLSKNIQKALPSGAVLFAMMIRSSGLLSSVRIEASLLSL
jgi:hypothetical protein